MVNCLLEGYVVQKRLGMDVDVDELTDAVLALFVGLTSPKDRRRTSPEQRIYAERA